MKSITRGILTLAAGASLSLGCAAPPGTVNENKKPSVATSSEPAKAAVCGIVETPDGPQPRFYVFSAMNHKLSHYPEFARAVGFSSVSDCEGAERYIDGYAAYLEDHPNFDDDESFDDVIVDDPGPEPADSPPRVEVQKILGGPDALNNPVVRISFDATNQGGHEIPESQTFGLGIGSCSGTFIAKNWILTAAHCMTRAAVYHCIKAGINPVLGNVRNPACTPKTPTYSQWTIQSKLADASLLILENVWAVAYVNPAWVGTDALKDPRINPVLLEGGVLNTVPGFADNDIALLYIKDDSVLPPEVEKDGAKRISLMTVPDFANWTFQAFGWGSGETLRTTGPNGMTLKLPYARRIDAEANMAQGSPCDGDSGGPLMRMNTNIVTNVSTTPQPVQVIVGVNSTGGGKAACDADMVPSGVRKSSWVNVAHRTNFEFIEKTIRLWNGNPTEESEGFRCLRRTVANEGILKQVAECWGSPCKSDKDCDPEFSGRTCSRSGNYYAFCPTCDLSPLPACSCMVGQCLDDPQRKTLP